MSNYIKRGNLMWEGSRMMLPEHIQALRAQKKDLMKDPKPQLNEYELTEIGTIAMESLRYNLDTRILYWNDGYDKEVTGVVECIDNQLKQLQIAGQWIKIEKLKWIERI